MKRTTAILAVFVLSGCALTPTQKKILIGTATVFAIGEIHAMRGGDRNKPSDHIGGPGNPCQSNPEVCR